MQEFHESILIKSAKCVSSDRTFESDIYIENGKIQDLGKISQKADKIIDGSSFYLIPGVIDTHVHFREPGLTWKEDMNSASKAALSGGVTSIFDMPNTLPSTVTLKDIEDKKKIASKKCLVNYNFYLAATNDNIDECKMHANIPGIKLFLGSSTGNLLLNDESALSMLFKESKHLIAVHAEDENIINLNKKIFGKDNNPLSHIKIRNFESAVFALKKVMKLSEDFKKRVHILHITSKEEVELLKGKSSFITAEVCPQHLLLNAPNVYLENNAFSKVNPPIRYEADKLALRKALIDGLIDVVATDHAPHTKQEKSLPFNEAPSGMPGVETLLPLILDMVNNNFFTINDAVKWLCENPAKCFKIKNKGFIKKGFDADLVLIDMKKEKKVEEEKLFTKCKWSIFNNFKLTGWPHLTILNGQLAFQEGDILRTAPGLEIEIDNI